MAQDDCATPAISNAQLAWQSKLLALQSRTQSTRLANTLQYIPIRFHVVRRSDGTGGLSISSLNQSLVLLNQVYQPAGVAFYMCGSTPHYIDNTALFDYDTSEEDALADGNDVSNAVNVYLLNTINYGGVQATGYSYYPGSLSITNRLFVQASQVTGNTLLHELGHYFNLYHTFQNSISSQVTDRELVIRPGDPQQSRLLVPNCSETGDLVCDTPADPYGLSGATVAGCQYTGTVTDANGDRYSPALNNLMSYYSGCSSPSNSFTPGQYARIMDGVSIRLDPGNEYTLHCADNPLAPTNLTISFIQTGVRIQFTYTGTDASGFLIERATSPTGSFTAIGSTPPGSFSFTDGTVVSNTTYYYRVKASNASTQYSAVQRIDVGLFYCIPAYAWPIANFVPKISDFILAGSQTTLRSIATGAGPAGYSDYSATELGVLPGRAYSFTASAITGLSGSYITQHLTIWLDSNQDGLLTDPEILYQSTTSQFMNPRVQNVITIPASFTLGKARLRLRSQYSPDGLVRSSCTTYNYGETEDYTLRSDVPTCFTLSATATAVHCAGGQDGVVSLSVAGGTSPFSFTLNNQLQPTGTFAGLAAGSYTATVTDATASCKQSLTITVSQPTAVTASLVGSTTSCGAQTLSLSVVLTGNAPPYSLQISNGASVSTVSGYVDGASISVFPSQTTSYSLLSVTDADGCPGTLQSRIATATVNPVPTASISPQSASACTGQSVTLTASGGSIVRWDTGVSSASLVATATGVYTVTVTSDAGCSGSATASVQMVDCSRTLLFQGKVLLEGFTSATTGLMHTLLASNNLLPKQQPYSGTPWSYSGTEAVTTIPANVTDWILVMARNATGSILAKKAVFVRNDGIILSLDGSEGVLFPSLTGPVYVSLHHRSHLAVQSSNTISDNQLMDFTASVSTVRGTNQMAPVGGKLAMYSGDYDANDIINSLDFNKWKINASTINKYLSADGDGNGVINNKDYNRWMLNRSKIGTPGL
ncbi:GEVED domain-containing protein [Fibrella forsythiae]|uniref:Peptidase M43 pregnancy-associated plasma-A domain-containing protein n=1 Tax=Fibrella forsythiae TaxID=2817061 RepID=A0ABS3JDU7_9BACT|nr:GEVED domain-containing protein [Fibrella forsythiae]MBO0948161.1 hypothetical protein [Fibrella forsythiae]